MITARFADHRQAAVRTGNGFRKSDYVLDADYCAGGSELIKKRNILFTAITRSRGWVRVSGKGQQMQTLIAEFEALKSNGFQLRFKVPTREELQQMRTLYRDITITERKKADDFQKAFEKILSMDGDPQAVLQALPKELRDRMIQTLREVDDI